MRRLLCAFALLIFYLPISHGKIGKNCRFAESFYENYPNIFELNQDQTLLTVRPLYSLSNQSFTTLNQSLSIGIIYSFADTYLVPVPLLFQCSESEQIYTPDNCEFTIVDTRSDLSMRRTEPTRTTTVPLSFQDYSSSSSKPSPLHGAYFKQSIVALQNCRLISDGEILVEHSFHLRIEFEQTIGSKCSHACSHSQLYECSMTSQTCQCRSHLIEKFGHFCVDTELTSNCSLTPERCRRLCNTQKQLQTGIIDDNCQCPLGTQRIRSSNDYRCELPILTECDNQNFKNTCPKGYLCQENRCIPKTMLTRVNQTILSVPLIMIGLLTGALLIIILLIAGLLKMRSVKCVKFVHQQRVLSNHSSNSSPATITRLSTVNSSSSPCSTLSSASKSTKLSSTNKLSEKYTKIHLFE
ncbi:unnamed protein product [Adineta ricciae]|uniref:Uncharacterized protein n=1 Tax=Adineta ricciae TaxID=249248 RepID=A0A815TIN7_ADIRI|nr:unnamed protein product [Adineta ricciae]CAF1504299.1 unnamed protein product [Adineta ricciae]